MNYKLLLLLLLVSCATKQTNKVNTSDTVIVSIIFKNPYNGNLPAISQAIKILRDSVHVDSMDRVTHQLDSFYYVPISYQVIDSNKKNLKTRDGLRDSINIQYPPVSAKNVLLDFNDRVSFRPEKK